MLGTLRRDAGRHHPFDMRAISFEDTVHVEKGLNCLLRTNTEMQGQVQSLEKIWERVRSGIKSRDVVKNSAKYADRCPAFFTK